MLTLKSYKWLYLLFQLHMHVFTHSIQNYRWGEVVCGHIYNNEQNSLFKHLSAYHCGRRTLAANLRMFVSPQESVFPPNTHIVCTPIPDLIPLILSVFKNINLGTVDWTVSGWWAQTVRLTSLSTWSSNNTLGARSHLIMMTKKHCSNDVC